MSRVELPIAQGFGAGRLETATPTLALISTTGMTRSIDVSVAPIRDEGREILGTVLVFRDVSERRVAERAFREGQSQKVAFLEAAIDCIITIDREGKIVEFNPAAEHTFAVSSG